MEYKPAIGLEIHAELLTETKMFCGCKNEFGGEVNVRVCPVCMGHPGTLPSLNGKAVELGIKSGLVLGCKINNLSAFDRKNYFYPDLPKSYQITQQFSPLCTDGIVELNGFSVRINNIHLEEDAGKLVHTENETTIDYNRCGVPLIEIVTEPDFTSADDVAEFVEELAQRLKYAGVCDGKIEQGSLRVDLNVSVAPLGDNQFGTRTETKNLGSVKALKKAVNYEISRQISVLEAGEKVVCETRRFDEKTGKTVALRLKENASEYRYFPEPDIPHIYASDEYVEKIRKTIPELPSERKKRYVDIYKLTAEEAKNIVSDREFSDYFDSVCCCTKYPKKAASLMLNGLNKFFNKYGGCTASLMFEKEELAELSALWGQGEISSANALKILETLYLQGGSAREIAECNDMLIKFDKQEAVTVTGEVISANGNAVNDYRNGNKRAFGFLMGLVMSRLGKNTDPASVKEILEEYLKG